MTSLPEDSISVLITADTAAAKTKIKDDLGRLGVDVSFTKRQIQSALDAKTKSAPPTVAVNAKFTRKQVQSALTLVSTGLFVNVDVRFNDKGANGIVAKQRQVQGQILAAQREQLTASERLQLRAAEAAQNIERRKQATLETLAARGAETRSNILLRERIRAERITSKPILQQVRIKTDRVSSSLNDLDRFTTRALSTSLRAFTAWSAGVVVAFAAVGAAALHTVTEVEKSTARAAGVVASDTISKEIEKNGKAVSNFGTVAAGAQKKITAAAAKIGLDTLFNTKEVADGILALTQSGQSLDQAIITVQASARAASVSGEELGKASEGLAAGLASAGLQAEDSSKLLDKFQFVANDTLGNVGDVTDAFANKSASSFRTYGQSVNETLLVLDLFGKTGIKGQAAGTAASIVIRDLSKAIGQNGDAFKKQGIRVRDAQHQNVTLVQTLTDLATAFGKTGGDIGATSKLAKGLGFQQKSLQFLLQLFPQVRQETEKGLNLKLGSIEGSAGAIQEQFDVIKKQLFFQLDQLRDTFSNALLTIGNAAATRAAKLVDIFAGNNGLVSRITPELTKLGNKIGDTLNQIAEFVQSPAFANGVKTIGEAFKTTIGGVADSARAFAKAFQSPGSDKSVFESLADSLLAFSQAAATTLPVVARVIGEVLHTLIENKDAFKTIAEIALALTLLRKSYTLLIRPILIAREAVVAFTVAQTASSTLGGITAATRTLAGLSDSYKAVETAALGATAAQEASVGASAARGAGATAAGGAAATTGVAAKRLGVIGTVAAAFTVPGGFSAGIEAATVALAGFGEAASAVVAPVAAVLAAIIAAAGVVKGFVDEIRSAGNDTGQFGDALTEIAKLKPVLDFLLTTVKALVVGVFQIGEAFGASFAGVLKDVVVVIGQIVSGVDQIVHGDFKSGFADLGSAIVNFLITPLKEGISFFIGEIAALLNVFARVPGVGGKFKDAAGAARNAAKDIRDFHVALDGTTGAGVRVDRSLGVVSASFANTAATATASAKVIAKAVGAAQAAAVAAANKKVLTPREQFNLFVGAGTKVAEQRQFGKFAKQNATAAAKALKQARSDLDASLASPGISPGSADGGAAAKAPDLQAQAAAEVAAQSLATRTRKIATLIASIDRAGAKGYRATRVETELLQRALPSVEASLQKQRDVVQKLTTDIDKLKNAQLAGTKAFSDAAFANDQAVKQLQLQRLDALAVPGTTDQSPQIKAIDDQIKALQTTAERASLVESLQLDPLKRKLQDTFNPVNELSFEQIISQFNKLSAAQTAQQTKLSGQEAQQKLLNDTLQVNQQRYQDIDTVAQQAAAATQAAGAAASTASAGFSDLASSAGTAKANIQGVNDAADAATKLGQTVNTNVSEGITAGVQQVNVSVGRLTASIRNNIAAVSLTTSPISLAATLAGRTTILAFQRGALSQANATLYPVMRQIGIRTGAELANGIPGALASGLAVMASFKKGLVQGFGEPNVKGSIAEYLNVTIPKRIAELKGPVSYDATILVPAGEAVMTGLDRGLRSGFGGVENFLKDVGPSMEEFVPDSIFSKKTADFMVDVALGKNPDPEKFFADLVPSGEAFPITGDIDPQLSFLHRTKSLFDTQQMAAKLAKLYQLSVTSTDRASGTLTSSGNVSDHTFGTAADLSGGVSNTDALVAAVKPLFGTIFKQIIWHNKDQNRGFFIPDHEDHAHLAWLMGKGFDKYSHKVGEPDFAKIPGASNIVSQAINQAAQKYHLPVALLAAIAKQESGFRPSVVSGDGGYGLFQLTSPGLKAQAGAGLLDPFVNADVGARYFKTLLNQFNGNTFKALAGYNGGPGAGAHPFAQVIKYANSVLSIFREFSKNFGGFRAMGGGVAPGQSYVVGERGPEIFRPNAAGRITSNRESNFSSTSAPSFVDSSTINITSNASDPRAVAAIVEANRKRRLAKLNV